MIKNLKFHSARIFLVYKMKGVTLNMSRLTIKMQLLIIMCIFSFGRCMQDVFMQKIHNSGVLIDGDIMMSENEDPWDRRLVIDMKNKRWPEGIVPYDLNATQYSLLDLYTIREGMKAIEKNTCIRFVPRDHHRDFIYITPLGGCWSYLGRMGSGQTLSLVSPHCIERGTVIHELLHTLGFWHEHSRPDRDEYIEVIWDNIISEDKQINFAKHMSSWSNWTDYPYDFKSVMHYSAYAFSKRPNLPTMLPKTPRIRLKDFGRAKTVGTLTNIDEEKINDFYECSIP